MDRMTIGEAAKAVGVSAKAIRLWEERGLIPTAARTIAGYRTFTRNELALLHFIRQGKTLGLSLDELREIIQIQHAGVDPCDRVVQAIDAHIAAIDQSLADLMKLRQTLAHVSESARQDQAESCQGIVCHIIERAATFSPDE